MSQVGYKPKNIGYMLARSASSIGLLLFSKRWHRPLLGMVRL